jgi:protocatechuate 3,4-dioxygenase beta subunit
MALQVIRKINKNDVVAFNGYMYRKDKVRIETIDWRCTVRGCKGRLITQIAFEEDEAPTERGI